MYLLRVIVIEFIKTIEEKVKSSALEMCRTVFVVSL